MFTSSLNDKSGAHDDLHGRRARRRPAPPSTLVAPQELAERWQCSRSSVDRIARRYELHRVCLGAGSNGMVRYLRAEVEALEARQTA